MGYSTYCSNDCTRETGHHGEHVFRPARLHEAIERIRANHDRSSGHSPTNLIAYCAESDGISATYCETGILLAALEGARTSLADCTDALTTVEMAYDRDVASSSPSADTLLPHATPERIHTNPTVASQAASG